MMSEPAGNPRIYVIGTDGGTKRVSPPVQVARAGSLIEFRNMTPFSEIVRIDFCDKRGYFSYNAADASVSVSPDTPVGYYEYDLTVRTFYRHPSNESEGRDVDEIAVGCSRPGVIVER